MTKNLIICTIIFAMYGCGQSYNSNSGDIAQYEPISGIDSSTPEGARLLAAYKALRTTCFSCHQSYSGYKTSQQWVDAGLVSPGNPSASTIFTILKNNGGRMPPEPVAQLTSEELASVEAWIAGL